MASKVVGNIWRNIPCQKIHLSWDRAPGGNKTLIANTLVKYRNYVVDYYEKNGQHHLLLGFKPMIVELISDEALPITLPEISGFLPPSAIDSSHNP